jgi:hypothetical protein
MANLLYFNAAVLANNKDKFCTAIPELENYLKIQRYLMRGIGFIDRSNTIKNPFNVTILNPLPKFDNTFSQTYSDCIMSRVGELDKLYQKTHRKFRLLYSGGIDSTAILAGFIEYYGLHETAKILEISCTPDSIDENPWAWDRYIRKGNFDIKSSINHRNGWTDDVATIMGEGADQLFGGSAFASWNKFMDNTNLYHPLNEDIVTNYLYWYDNKATIDEARYAAQQLIEITKIAPFPIDNMYLFVWWHKFVLDWEAVMVRVLSFSNISKFDDDFLTNNLIQFYNTENFQQWSMNFHKDYPTNFAEKEHYKRACKDFILKTLDIPEYANKNKYLSWPRVHSLIPAAVIIDDSLTLYHNPESFLNFIQT